MNKKKKVGKPREGKNVKVRVPLSLDPDLTKLVKKEFGKVSTGIGIILKAYYGQE